MVIVEEGIATHALQFKCAQQSSMSSSPIECVDWLIDDRCNKYTSSNAALWWTSTARLGGFD
jgi:hypothetical protein